MIGKANGANWSPYSWKRFTTLQQPQYDDEQEYNQTLLKIQQSPGIVELKSIQRLRDQLKDVSLGKKFIVQAGDCAEMFDDCQEIQLQRKINFFQELSQILSFPVVLIGRICGQFAKPRSQEYEREGLMSYKGDLINGLSEDQRKPDPQRLIRALQLQQSAYKTIDSRVFISHECLHLDYESSLVRQDVQSYYNSSSQFIWIGERTRGVKDGHVHFVSGLENPCGVKISSNITCQEFNQICHQLNPSNLDDKLIIITRMGAKKISDGLRNLIKWRKESEIKFIWMCDPMHGNTITTLNGSKTRLLRDIKEEIKIFIDLLRESNEIPGGIHLEATADDVKECLEDQSDLQKYNSACDPRLNKDQSIEVLRFLNELLQY